MNEHRVKQQQMQEASRQFLRALSAGQAGAPDRFGKMIQPGNQVLYRTPFDLIFTVVSVTPVLDPNSPPGLLDVTLSVTFPLRVPANRVNPNAVIVQEGTPPQANAEVQPDAPPVGDDPPADDPPAGPRLVDPSGAPISTEPKEL